jgi:hypothetical protein
MWRSRRARSCQGQGQGLTPEKYSHIMCRSLGEPGARDLRPGSLWSRADRACNRYQKSLDRVWIKALTPAMDGQTRSLWIRQRTRDTWPSSFSCRCVFVGPGSASGSTRWRVTLEILGCNYLLLKAKRALREMARVDGSRGHALCGESVI